jgi:hypothetical protein
MGKSAINGGFSTAMLVYQRVTARAEAVCMRGPADMSLQAQAPFSVDEPPVSMVNKTGR